MAREKYKVWLEPDNLIRIEGWARDGLTEEQIAQKMGVAPKTLREWKNTRPAIGTALKKGKEVVDYIVESALCRRAIGYDYEEITTEISGDTKHIRKVKRHVPPDVTAQIFWLKNRRPDKWRDKPLNIDPNSDELKKAREILAEVESAIN